MQVLLQLFGSESTIGNASNAGTDNETEAEAGFSLSTNIDVEAPSEKELNPSILLFKNSAEGQEIDLKPSVNASKVEPASIIVERPVRATSQLSLSSHHQSKTDLDHTAAAVKTATPYDSVETSALNAKTETSDRQITVREFGLADKASASIKAKEFIGLQRVEDAAITLKPAPVIVGDDGGSNVKTPVSNEGVNTLRFVQNSGSDAGRTPEIKSSPSPAGLGAATEAPRQGMGKSQAESVENRSIVKSTTNSLSSRGDSAAEKEFPPNASQKAEGLSVRAQKPDLRTTQLEKPIQTNSDRVVVNQPVSAKLTAPKETAVEIRLIQNGTENVQPGQQKAELLERQTPTPRSDFASQQNSRIEPVLAPRPDARRQEYKPSNTQGRPIMIEPEGPKIVPELTKQSYQMPQTNSQQALPTLAAPMGTIEPSQFTDGPLSRDTGIQLSGEGPEVRRDSTAPSKIDAFARPVAHQLAQAAKTMSDGSIEVRLAPEELGRVRLSLNPGETNITVHISAERQETMDLIRRNLELFSQTLKQEGFSNLAFSFGDSGNEQSGAKEKEADIILSDENQIAENTSIPLHRMRSQASGQLDIRI